MGGAAKLSQTIDHKINIFVYLFILIIFLILLAYTIGYKYN